VATFPTRNNGAWLKRVFDPGLCDNLGVPQDSDTSH
jgi:hypothetical protein